MAKRKKKRAPKQKAATVDYVDGEGNVLSLRESLSAGTIAKLGEGPATAATSQEDAWHRRSELLFERLAVRWEIAGLPLDRPEDAARPLPHGRPDHPAVGARDDRRAPASDIFRSWPGSGQ